MSTQDASQDMPLHRAFWPYYQCYLAARAIICPGSGNTAQPYYIVIPCSPARLRHETALLANIGDWTTDASGAAVIQCDGDSYQTLKRAGVQVQGEAWQEPQDLLKWQYPHYLRGMADGVMSIEMVHGQPGLSIEYVQFKQFMWFVRTLRFIGYDWEPEQGMQNNKCVPIIGPRQIQDFSEVVEYKTEPRLQPLWHQIEAILWQAEQDAIAARIPRETINLGDPSIWGAADRDA